MVCEKKGCCREEEEEKRRDYKYKRNEKRNPSKDELGAFLTLNCFSSPASLSDSLHRLGDDSCGTVYTDVVLIAAGPSTPTW